MSTTKVKASKIFVRTWRLLLGNSYWHLDRSELQLNMPFLLGV